MVESLIEKGANINARDNDGLSPLDYARQNNKICWKMLNVCKWMLKSLQIMEMSPFSLKLERFIRCVRDTKEYLRIWLFDFYHVWFKFLLSSNNCLVSNWFKRIIKRIINRFVIQFMFVFNFCIQNSSGMPKCFDCTFFCQKTMS